MSARLSAVTLVLLSLSITIDVGAETEEPTANERAVRALELSETNSEQTETLDLAGFDEAMLRVLCQSLYARVAQLENQIAQLSSAGLDTTRMRTEIARLKQEAASLRAENGVLRERLADRPVIVHAPEEPGPGTAAVLNDEVLVDPAYTYEYELFLISQAGRESVRIRDRTGALIERASIRWEEYSTNAITARCFFRNDADYPARFSLLVAVGKPWPGLFKKDPIILGKTIYETPYLNPGEIHDFTVEIQVQDIREIQSAGIKPLRAYTGKNYRPEDGVDAQTP